MENRKEKPWMEVKELTHSFGEKKVLDHISFQIGKGKMIGLLGPSGAGKTTLVNILTGQLKPDGGTVRLTGESNRKAETYTAGIMMDSFGLYERLSVWDNMKLFAKIYGVPVERIGKLLDRAGLWQARKTAVGRLSKGMRSRVNLCRALLKEADILFLDEPTSGLDPATTEKIHGLLMEEKEAGTTVFLTTHNMQEAAGLCDYIFLLHEGKIVEQGAPKDICRKYNSENRIEVILKCGETHIIPNAKESAAALAGWMDAEEVLSVHSSEPDLEHVFLLLTGKKLAG